FSPINEETKADLIQRASIGYTQGLLTRNEAREIIALQPTKDKGEEFKQDGVRDPLEQDSPEEKGKEE
ncbi:MAG: hypothetical protein HOC79_08895, partial [Euryarchaeota archaeon]|nr:hypothetical protein [Euryarchaeota archaeon]